MCLAGNGQLPLLRRCLPQATCVKSGVQACIQRLRLAGKQGASGRNLHSESLKRMDSPSAGQLEQLVHKHNRRRQQQHHAPLRPAARAEGGTQSGGQAQPRGKRDRRGAGPPPRFSRNAHPDGCLAQQRWTSCRIRVGAPAEGCCAFRPRSAQQTEPLQRAVQALSPSLPPWPNEQALHGRGTQASHNTDKLCMHVHKRRTQAQGHRGRALSRERHHAKHGCQGGYVQDQQVQDDCRSGGGDGVGGSWVGLLGGHVSVCVGCGGGGGGARAMGCRRCRQQLASWLGSTLFGRSPRMRVGLGRVG